jgi:hypothetical protein
LKQDAQQGENEKDSHSDRTQRTKIRFGTEGTCSASTCRSGSAMVIMIPINGKFDQQKPLS